MSKNNKTIEELLNEAIAPEDKQLYEVPENWVWTKFGKVAKLYNGYAFKSTDYQEEGIPVIRISDITGEINSIQKAVKVPSQLYNERFLVRKGDLLIAMSGATTGKTGVYNSDEIALQNQRVGNIKEINQQVLYPKFKNYYVFNNSKEILKNAYGGAQPNISGSLIEQLSFPLPPLKEQKRIAEKVERLLNKIEEAKQLIEEAKETLELRRAAILDKAFHGELTRKWRQRSTVISPAKKWMEEINSLKEGSKTKFKDQLDPGIIDILYKLPNEWEWVRLKDIMESSTYGTSSKTNDDVTGTPVLRMGNIVDGYLELNDLKYLPNNHDDVLKYDLQTNDLLFNRTNSYELVGKTAVITEEISDSFTFASYLIRVRLFNKDILASYISHYINSHIGRKILSSMVIQQVGQANINSQKLASLPIPLPPKEEVVEITKWLNSYRELENKQKEMLFVEESIETLNQSILSKAFRGELGTNDPHEESATELLKEILQEQVK
ncbi:restriction endonuclease subunit S [Neobacillus niacini]|uniref:restriction endonuclease subunit S n=1 Tax=Neobacillus niacini TaxID=86668 RepID=UPI0021CAF1B7|nr:restriction endonuclease subunit S [Neobacillus niacini]MCM3768379.1 restriction endonuclease subunit S [Neobacillus niacini]